mgnify:CR=1 FL=1
MSQNNSDNAAYYTAQHTSHEQQVNIAHLHIKLDQLKDKLKEISDGYRRRYIIDHSCIDTIQN